MGGEGTEGGVLRCARCGQRIVRRRTGAFAHASRSVAACDLDSDHAVAPDWAALGPLSCRRCGDEVVGRGAEVVHTDPARDADHPADPALPLA